MRPNHPSDNNDSNDDREASEGPDVAVDEGDDDDGDEDDEGYIDLDDPHQTVIELPSSDQDENENEDQEDEDDDTDAEDRDDDDEGVRVEEVGTEPLDEMMVDVEETSQVRFLSHTDSIYCVAASPADAHLVVTGGGDDTAYLWNSATGAELFKLSGHTDSVIDVGFNATGTMVATAGMDGHVKVWDVATGNLIATLEGSDELTWVEWHPRGNILLGGATDGSAYLWMSNGTLMQVYAGHASPLSAGGFTPDGKTIVTASEDATLTVWDPKTATARFRISSDDGRFHQNMITSVAFHPGSQLIATSSADGTIKLVQLESHKILASFHQGSEVERVAFSPVLPILAAGSSDGKVYLWDIQTFRQRHVLQHDDCIVKIVWHPTAPYLFTASADRATKVWDARDGRLAEQFRSGTDALLDMTISK